MLLKAGHPVELTSGVLRTLHEHGITTVEQFLSKDPHALPLGSSLVIRLQRKIYSKLVLEPRTLSDLYTRAVNNQAVISTGEEVVDELLGGGFLTGEHVDVCGEPNVRSDFCLQSISKLIRTDASASVIYVDSGSNFHPEKLVNSFDCDLAHLKRIQTVFLSDISEVLTFLDHIHRGRLRPKMIVINSIVDLVKPFMIFNDPLVALGILNHIAATIRSIAEHLKLVFLTTNDLIKNGPAMGKMWLGAPHMRINVSNLREVVATKSTRKLETS